MKEQEINEAVMYVISQNDLAALQDFIGSLPLPWKQTNPYMQLIGGLKQIKIQTAPAGSPVDMSAPVVKPSAPAEPAAPTQQEENILKLNA